MYTISVTAAGFGTLVRQPDVEVRVNDRLRIDFALQVGEVSQTVAVHGSAPLLQTEDATEASFALVLLTTGWAFSFGSPKTRPPRASHEGRYREMKEGVPKSLLPFCVK